MPKTCLKCGHQRQAGDTAPDYECPQCGAIYVKVKAAIKARSEKAAADRNKDQAKIGQENAGAARATLESPAPSAG